VTTSEFSVDHLCDPEQSQRPANMRRSIVPMRCMVSYGAEVDSQYYHSELREAASPQDNDKIYTLDLKGIQNRKETTRMAHSGVGETF
jgi:hypothetical protein